MIFTPSNTKLYVFVQVQRLPADWWPHCGPLGCRHGPSGGGWRGRLWGPRLSIRGRWHGHGEQRGRWGWGRHLPADWLPQSAESDGQRQVQAGSEYSQRCPLISKLMSCLFPCGNGIFPSFITYKATLRPCVLCTGTDLFCSVDSDGQEGEPGTDVLQAVVTTIT